jgi:hypothetical protein
LASLHRSIESNFETFAYPSSLWLDGLAWSKLMSLMHPTVRTISFWDASFWNLPRCNSILPNAKLHGSVHQSLFILKGTFVIQW